MKVFYKSMRNYIEPWGDLVIDQGLNLPLENYEEFLQVSPNTFENKSENGYV